MKDKLLTNPQAIEEVKRVEALLRSRASARNFIASPAAPHAKAQMNWLYVGEHKRAIPAVVESGEDGYTVTTPVLNGCIAEGDTIQEALQDFRKGLHSVLEVYKEEAMPVPWECHPLTEIGKPGIRIFTVLI